MRRQRLDIEHRKTMRGEDILHRQQRQIIEMLVIDGVELHALDQAQQVGEFDADDTVRLEGGGQPGDEIVDVRHMRQHVVRHDQVRREPARHKIARCCPAEKTRFRGDTNAPRGLGHIGGAVRSPSTGTPAATKCWRR
jgi:hypothetical protein